MNHESLDYKPCTLPLSYINRMRNKASNVYFECKVWVLLAWFLQTIYKRKIVCLSFLRTYRQTFCNSGMPILYIWTWKNEKFQSNFKTWILQIKPTKIIWYISQRGHVNVASIRLRSIITYCQIRIWIGSKPDQFGLQCNKQTLITYFLRFFTYGAFDFKTA